METKETISKAVNSELAKLNKEIDTLKATIRKLKNENTELRNKVKGMKGQKQKGLTKESWLEKIIWR